MDRRWVGAVAAALAAVGLVAALGGFAPAPQRSTGAGQVIHLARWDLTAHRAELVDADADGTATDPTVRVWFTVVNTWTDSQIQPWGLVRVVLPDGTAPDDASWQVEGRSGGFDPDVPQEAFLEVDVDPGWTGDRPLTVQVFDEQRSNTPAPIEVWGRTAAVAVFDLTCEDHR